MFCNFLVLRHCVKYSLLVEIASRFTCPNECFFLKCACAHGPSRPCPMIFVRPSLASCRFCARHSLHELRPSKFHAGRCHGCGVIFGSFLQPFATQIWMCPHGFQFESIFSFCFYFRRVLTLHRGCRMPIGSLVLALLQHLNYPGCAVTTCDLNRYWGYLGLLGLDGCTKAGEGKGDRLTMIDRCLKWPAAGRCSSQMFSIKREFYRMWRRYLHKTL